MEFSRQEHWSGLPFPSSEDIPDPGIESGTPALQDDSGSDGTVCPSAGDPGSIPGLGRSPGEGKGYPLQCSCLGNTTDRGALWAIVHGVIKGLDTT